MNSARQKSQASLDTSSSEDDLIDDICIDDQELNDIDVPSRKPHFLDYDAIPPPEFENTTFAGVHGGQRSNHKGAEVPSSSRQLTSTLVTSQEQCRSLGENVKMDKKYERDGEISDYELAASGFTKKEIFPQRKLSYDNERNTGARRKKHFLDENPIPPDYMMEKDQREHRSLDRCFDRQQTENDSLRYGGRKHSLDRDSLRSSRKMKDSNSSLFRNVETEPSSLSPAHRNNWPTDRPIETANICSTSQDNQLASNNKVECVYTLLSMLGSQDPVEMSKKLLELSRTPETCATLRQSGCIPLLVQMMHSDSDAGTRKRAASALHNIVHYQPDDKTGRREAKVLRLIEHIMEYCGFLKTLLARIGETVADDPDRHPLAAVSSLMKVSFDEEHRHAMCQLGALQAIANIFHLDHAVHGPKPQFTCCNSLRRYALMALTNLTFGDGNNKALLCANREFMEALVAQLDSAPDDLLQVTGSVLRNLSWRADNNMKAVLNEIGTVTALTKAAMKNKNENTLKSILSALWNLSAHCSTNKAEFCAVEGALAFLVDMLQYEGPSKTLTIVENAGGILRNVSSRIAVREDYRVILRQRNCLGILLQQLKSESLTVVSNACGILWNLSARVPEDQKFLWDNGAVPMLRSLIHSKHKMIAEGSSAALKNLQNYRPTALNQSTIDPIARSMGLKELPTLNARKQRTLEQELNQNLSETYDNIDAVTPPKEKKDFLVTTEVGKHWNNTRLTKSAMVSKSESRDSIVSAKSDSVYEKLRRGCSAPPDHGDLIDQETEYPIDYSAKYNSEVVENQIEDTVKCYETEGTPYIISNAASVSDLRNPKVEEQTTVPLTKDTRQKQEVLETNAFGSGMYTPEKPVNYCEEGTPGYFSRYESLSSLEESPQNPTVFAGTKVKPEIVEEETSTEIGICAGGTGRISPILHQAEPENPVELPLPASPIRDTISQPVAVVEPVSQSTPAPIPINSAQETPLMYSRRSSMDSLTSVEPNTADDKSSVVSDFSRMASGIISPSEIPDSPTQSMPQSPRRNSSVNPPFVTASIQQNSTSQPSAQKSTSIAQQSQPLRSVFEDEVNKFHVENTPAQFSCATSLSNLSLEDEPHIIVDTTEVEHNDPEMNPQVNGVGEPQCKVDKPAPESSTSTDGEEGFADNALLASCINMGMNRGSPSTKRPQSVISQNVPIPKEATFKEYTNEDDFVKSYYTEDTPAVLSKVGSNSNLSALSINTNKDQNVNLSDESSVSDGSNDLLEQCIREGMQKSSSKERVASSTMPSIPVKDPIAMLRCGGLPPYLPVRDEMNKFVVENSPCTFSVLSGLSGLTVGSGVAGPANIKRVAEKPVDPAKPKDQGQRQTAEDSLSSISMESDDEHILNQAIAAGCNKLRRDNGNASLRKVETGIQNMHIGNLRDANDSLSSVDSSDSNDNQAKTLFELCVRAGMNKQRKPERPVPKQINIPKQSQLPVMHTTSKTPMQVERDRRKEREQRDEQLLKECINIGIASKCGRLEPEIRPPTRHVKPVLAPTEFGQRFGAANAVAPPMGLPPSTMNASIPKNGETTSVAVLEQQQQLEPTTSYSAPNTAPGVGMKESPDGTSTELRNLKAIQRSDHQTRIENLLNITGSDLLVSSNGSLNLCDSNCALQQSNEYPALKLSNIDYNDDSVNESSFEMEISNEFLIEKDDIEASSTATTQPIHDKHKDPDLMLKSVERLTLELVSTAEYLRTNASNNSELESNEFDSNNTIFERKSGSTSNNTWNEDTCPNDVSFPSVSITAPMIASLNEDETTMSDICLMSNRQVLVDTTPTNEEICFTSQQWEGGAYKKELNGKAANSQPTSIDTETDTLVNDEIDGNTLDNVEAEDTTPANGIHFQVGGEVQSQLANGTITHQFVSSGPMSFESCSTMSSSTIIAMEANKLAHQFMQNMVESTTSLDLDNVRPPSGMDCISLSGCPESTPLSPQLSRMRKKSLPPGLMAKRALSGGGQMSNVLSGSAESVNSICNLLDNIKPPSLMDELLDSMISVASIQSEIVDHTIQSNYETAFSDIDENTMTLQSCMDAMLPTDDYDESNNGTPIPSDFSSAESTPRKNRTNNANSALGGVKRTLTPKQKRRIIKDRFKTYTIAADYVLKESFTGEQIEQYEDCQQQIHSDEGVQDDDEILQIEIEHGLEREQAEAKVQADELVNNNIMRSVKRRSLDPERYRTRTIVYNTETESLADPATYTVDQETMSTEEDTEELQCPQPMTRQFRYITESETLSPRKHGIFRAKIPDEEAHRTESDFNSIEFDQNSETESCDQNLNRTTDDEMSPKRCYAIPRILKPSIYQPATDDSGVESGNVHETEIKSVRGRKKPAYVSPYRRSAVSGGSSRTTSPKSQIGSTTMRANLSAKTSPDLKKNLASKIVPKSQTTKTHVLMNKSEITTKANNSAAKSRLARPGFVSSATGGKKNVVAQKNLLNKRMTTDLKTQKSGAVETPKQEATAVLERQGTFVKDEPSTPELPVVTSLPPSPSKSSKLPTKTASPKRVSQLTTPKSPAKTATNASKYRTPVQKSASSDIPGKLTPKGLSSLTPKPKNFTSSATDLNRRKLSLIGVKKSPSVPTVPQRSNSNASIRSSTTTVNTAGTNPPSRSNSNLTTARPVTSRIAGIWKKTDDTKKSPLLSKPATGKPPSGSGIAPTKLIRSSTFDNSPETKPTNVSNIPAKTTPKATTTGIAMRRKEETTRTAPGSTASNLVLRRQKISSGTSETTPSDDGVAKRVSRLGTFINIEGDCQVAG